MTEADTEKKNEFFIRVNQNTHEIINISTTDNLDTTPKNTNLSNFLSREFDIKQKVNESCGENDEAFEDNGEFDDDEFDDKNLHPIDDVDVEKTYKETVPEKIKGILQSTIASQIIPVTSLSHPVTSPFDNAKNNLEENITQELVSAIPAESKIDESKIKEQLEKQIAEEATQDQVVTQDPVAVVDNNAEIIAKITELIKSKLSEVKS